MPGRKGRHSRSSGADQLSNLDGLIALARERCQELAPRDCHALVGSGAMIVDVRDEGAIAAGDGGGVIQGSVPISLGWLPMAAGSRESRDERLADKRRVVITTRSINL